MIYLLLASPSKHKSGQAIAFANELEFGSSLHQFDDSEAVPRIDKIEVYAMQKTAMLGKNEDIGALAQKAALDAAHALLSTQPLLSDEEKLGPLWADIYLNDDVNTEVWGDSGGIAYSLRLLEKLAGFDIDGSQRFVDAQNALRELVIGATGTIDVVGQVGPVEGVEAKLEAFVHQLQKDWSKIQTTTGQDKPRIVFLLPKDNLKELDHQLLNQARETLHALSPNVDIVGIDQLAEAIRTLLGDLFPVSQQDQSPYKGLNAFDPQDRLLFFGREKKVQDTLEKLTKYSVTETAHRHCIVFGDSGAGKSSFVKAGLLPRLSQQEHSTLQNWVILKPGDGQGQLFDHFIDSLRPTLDPNHQEKLFNLPWRANPHEAVSGFADLYASARVNSLVPVTDSVPAISPASPISFVLVIDQAEELLRMPGAKNDINQFKAALQAFSIYHLTNNPNTEGCNPSSAP